jgi:hypothetical protein
VKGEKMLVSYVLLSNIQISYVTGSVPDFIEKMTFVGAKNFCVYKIACPFCQNGLLVIDGDGTTEPCSQCVTGSEWAKKYRIVNQPAQVESDSEIPF